MENGKEMPPFKEGRGILCEKGFLVTETWKDVAAESVEPRKLQTTQ
jgi:hypothetical protein